MISASVDAKKRRPNETQCKQKTGNNNKKESQLYKNWAKQQ